MSDKSCSRPASGMRLVPQHGNLQPSLVSCSPEEVRVTDTLFCCSMKTASAKAVLLSPPGGDITQVSKQSALKQQGALSSATNPGYLDCTDTPQVWLEACWACTDKLYGVHAGYETAACPGKKSGAGWRGYAASCVQTPSQGCSGLRKAVRAWRRA